VGDYGLIDKETGEFQAQGNIYNESLQERFRSTFNFDLKIEALQPQVQEHGDEEFIAKSWGVTIGLSMHLLERRWHCSGLLIYLIILQHVSRHGECRPQCRFGVQK
jgi:hypothetical protein